MLSGTGEWGRALTALQERLGLEDVATRVVRVEVRKDASQVWTIEAEAGPAWFSYAAGRLRQLTPRDESKLPGAPKLLHGERVLSWRPGRRGVAVASDGSGIYKLFRPRRLRAALLKHSRVERHRESLGPWNVAGIAEVDHAASAILFERLEGEPVPVQRAAARTWRLVGTGLRAFQQAVPSEELSWHGRGDELDAVVRMHRRYALAFQQKLEGVDAHLDALTELMEAGGQMDGRPRVASHRDLHDGQLLSSDGRIHVLDFDQLAAAEPELDLANLTAHMVLRRLQHGDLAPSGEDLACATEVLAGYEVANTDQCHEALRFYQAATFVRLALLYGLRPRWRGLVPLLLDHAGAALRELPRA